MVKDKQEPQLCKCGCGDYAKPGNRFIIGHNQRGIKTSNIIKEKMRLVWTQEKRNYQSERLLQYHEDHPEAREKAREKANEQWSSQEVRDEASERNIEYLESHPGVKEEFIKRNNEYWSHQENRDMASERKTEYWSYQKNRDAASEKGKEYVKNHPEIHNDVNKITLICEQCGDEFKVKSSNIDRIFCSNDCYGEWQSKNKCGENNPNWQGGISFDPYCEKFNKAKKKEVRDKYDNCDYLTGIHRNICNVIKPGKVWELAVHHFDYDKMQGCNEVKWKLIPVSHKHNLMFNKNRPFWERLIGYSLEYDKDYYK